ncbi:MAG: carbonic anhydrase [Actinomycetota bacterium]
MNNKIKVALASLAVTALVAIGVAASAAGASWSYSGDTGSNHWATIDPTNYATCADGTMQSPINLKNAVPTPMKNLKFDYTEGEAGIFNNGHTVEAEPLGAEENTMTLGGDVYPFVQFHFHAPSEHQINGMHYPVEIHFVHKTEAGNIAVVGVFLKAGKDANEGWSAFVDKMNDATADPEETTVDIDWESLLPKNRQTIRYNGSLTTPGCTEGVKWNVFTNPVIVSQEQINAFLEAYSGNNRPVQPLNGRKVKLDSTPRK